MTSRQEMRKRIHDRKREDSKQKQKINDWKYHNLSGSQSCSKKG